MNTIFGINLILFLTAQDVCLANLIYNPHSHSLRIFGVPPSKGVAAAEFFTTYAISVISAALGLAKCLKNGVARPIAPGGPLDGFLTWKFMVALVAIAVVLLPKSLIIGFTAVSPSTVRETINVPIAFTFIFP